MLTSCNFSIPFPFTQSEELILAAKKITIMILPEGNRKVRQLKIPKSFISLSVVILLLAACSVAWMVRDYLDIRKKMPRLVKLQKENTEQKIQLASLAHRIDLMGKKMMDLKQFDNKLKVMVNLEPSEDNTQFLGIGGSDPSVLNGDFTAEKVHRKLVRMMHKSLDNLDTEISVQTFEKAELINFLENQKSILACTPSIWPTKGWISSRFGYRISPFTNEKEFHRGLDICNRMKAPIVAPADGVVTSVGKDYGYGRMLCINHDHGIKTKYAHLNEILVNKGDYVKRGQKIALVGQSGRTTGPHLHYEVHLNGVPVDPLRYILN